jgi:NTP pyrophosphatase (non-canonical NTP hydrolase)
MTDSKKIDDGGKVLRDVLDERKRQDEKWGEQNHNPFIYLTILMEEVGETAKAILETRYGGPEAGRIREEAVQVAAVAIAIVECLDRGKWSWKESKDAR